MPTMRVAFSPLQSVLLIVLALASGVAAFSVTRPYNHGVIRPIVDASYTSGGVRLQKTLQFLSTESEEPTEAGQEAAKSEVSMVIRIESEEVEPWENLRREGEEEEAQEEE